MVNRSNRALVKMRFDADVNQRRESGCDEDSKNNGHLITLKQTKRKTINKFNAGGRIIHLVIELRILSAREISVSPGF